MIVGKNKIYTNEKAKNPYHTWYTCSNFDNASWMTYINAQGVTPYASYPNCT